MTAISLISPRLTVLNCGLLVLTSWVLYKLASNLRKKSPNATKLRGPKAKNPIFGVAGLLAAEDDPSVYFEQWAKEYGNAYQIPAPLGYRAIVMLDPKAISYFYSKDTYSIGRSNLDRWALREFVGKQS